VRGICALQPKEQLLATPLEMNAFLAQSERRAFKQAMFAVREEEAALDIVQDSMMKLAEKYADKPVEELPMLFTRIVQNTILDYFRRTKVRNQWTTLLGDIQGSDSSDDDFDLLEALEVESGAQLAQSPQQALEQEQVMAVIESVIEKLPPRQREAFLLRYWEELDTTETAQAMGCSEGSVKTHCSRAVHALAQALKQKGISL
jgi:RNA polymerase sigma-70 factor (ECF subfamily)